MNSVGVAMIFCFASDDLMPNFIHPLFQEMMPMMDHWTPKLNLSDLNVVT